MVFEPEIIETLAWMAVGGALWAITEILQKLYLK